MEVLVAERRVCAYERCDERLPVDAAENMRFHHPRCKSAQWRLARARPGRVKPSGRQVSYAKAVRELVAVFGPHAEDVLARALPERQRAGR